MLKKFIDAFRVPQVELVFCTGELLHFRSPVAMKVGDTRNVRAMLPGGESLGAVLKIHSQDARTGNYVGQLREPASALPHLRQLLPLPFEERRSSKRVHRNVRIMSPNLKGFVAHTRDLSTEGLCLLVGQAVNAGSTMTIQMDLDASSQEPLRLGLEVRWVEALPSGHHMVGARFQNVTRGQRHVLQAYLDANPLTNT